MSENNFESLNVSVVD